MTLTTIPRPLRLALWLLPDNIRHVLRDGRRDFMGYGWFVGRARWFRNSRRVL